MEQTLPSQDRGLLAVLSRLVLRDHASLVLGGEGPPGRARRRIDRHLPTLLGGLPAAAHANISSHALQANPERRGVSHQPDREGRDTDANTSATRRLGFVVDVTW